MDRILAILAIASAAFAGLIALLLNGTIVALAGVLAVVAAVFCILTRTRNGIIVGVVLGLVGLLAVYAPFGGVSGEDAEAGSFSIGFGQAMAVSAGVLVVAAVAALRWDDFDPSWLNYAAVGLAALTVVLAFVYQNELGSLAGMAYVVGLLGLLTAVPAGLLLREG